MRVPSSFLLSWLIALALSQNVIATHNARQLPLGSTSTPATSPTTTPTTPATTPTTTPTTPATSSSTVSTDTSTTTSPTTTSPTTTSATATSAPPPTTTASAAPVTTPSTTNTDTGAITVTTTNTASTTSDSSTPPPTHSSNNSSSSLGTGPIIGMSVAGGIAIIGIIAFFIWKFSRKRFSDFDDNEAIKWPELNTHGGSGADSHPLPLHNTGRAGFDTGSEASLSRVPSTSNYSTPDIGGGNHDPYAVPPLPHLNPNHPYRDDPTGQSGYYDPYNGPVPNTLEHGADWSGEAIPMTQMAGPNTGRMSPAHNPYGTGRASPSPHTGYGRTSPGPQAAYGAGRMSPGPQAAYGP